MENPNPTIQELLDFCSVEDLDVSNSRVVFISKMSEVFRDSDCCTTKTVDGKEYVPWGVNDTMPYDIIDLVEKDETLSTCQLFNAEVCYGSGIVYCTKDADAGVSDAVRGFLLDNPMPGYLLGVCQDLKYFNFAVSVIILNGDGTKIVELHRKPACYCRFSPRDKTTGRIENVIFGPFRSPALDDTFESIPLLDPRSPWKDLQSRMGRRATRRGTAAPARKFAILTLFPGVDSLYYPIPHYASLFKGSWYSIKRLIGSAKLAKLKNSAPIKYVIEVMPQYWEEVFRQHPTLTPEERNQLMQEKKREMMKFLTDAENSGAVLFTGKTMSLDGKGDCPHITVKSVDSKTKEGGDWESDIAEAVNMVCFTMRVHSNLVGSVPGKSQTNNSGSDKRELYTIAQALQKPYHDLLATVHDIIIMYNGWKGVHVDFPFIQLTTLDRHADAREVTVG